MIEKEDPHINSGIKLPPNAFKLFGRFSLIVAMPFSEQATGEERRE